MSVPAHEVRATSWSCLTWPSQQAMRFQLTLVRPERKLPPFHSSARYLFGAANLPLILGLNCLRVIRQATEGN